MKSKTVKHYRIQIRIEILISHFFINNILRELVKNMLIGYIKVSQHQQQEKKQALKVISHILNCATNELEQAEEATVADSIWPFNSFLSKPVVPVATSKVTNTQSEVVAESHMPARSLTEMLMHFVDRE